MGVGGWRERHGGQRCGWMRRVCQKWIALSQQLIKNVIAWLHCFRRQLSLFLESRNKKKADGYGTVHHNNTAAPPGGSAAAATVGLWLKC